MGKTFAHMQHSAGAKSHRGCVSSTASSTFGNSCAKRSRSSASPPTIACIRRSSALRCAPSCPISSCSAARAALPTWRRPSGCSRSTASPARSSCSAPAVRPCSRRPRSSARSSASRCCRCWRRPIAMRTCIGGSPRSFRPSRRRRRRSTSPKRCVGGGSSYGTRRSSIPARCWWRVRRRSSACATPRGASSRRRASFRARPTRISARCPISSSRAPWRTGSIS